MHGQQKIDVKEKFNRMWGGGVRLEVYSIEIDKNLPWNYKYFQFDKETYGSIEY